jgi:hypothetical protein
MGIADWNIPSRTKEILGSLYYSTFAASRQASGPTFFSREKKVAKKSDVGYMPMQTIRLLHESLCGRCLLLFTAAKCRFQVAVRYCKSYRLSAAILG